MFVELIYCNSLFILKYSYEKKEDIVLKKDLLLG